MPTMSNVNTNSMTHDEQCLENAIKKQLQKYIGRVECIRPTSDAPDDMESQDDFDYLLWAFKQLNLRDKVVMQHKKAISQYEQLTTRNLFPSITSSLKECKQKIDSKQTLIKAIRDYVENGKLSVLYELYFYLVNRHEPNQNHEPRLYSNNTYGGCIYVLSCDETFTNGGTRLLWMDIERYEPNDSNTGTKILFSPRPKEDNFDDNGFSVLPAVEMFLSSLDTNSYMYINARNRLDGLKCIHFSVGLDKGYSGRSIRAALMFLLISYLLELPLYPRIAITGDLDVQGNILYVAGIVGKTKAGIEEGIELICFPEVNWNELQSALPIISTNQRSQYQLVRIHHISQLQWLNFIYILISNVTNPSSTEKVKESSREALDYMCQGIKAKDNTILTAIVHGMQEGPPDHVRLVLTNAMLNVLELTKQNFENPDERDIIILVICEATQATNPQIRVTALQCLVKIMSLYYNFIEQYMVEALLSITVGAMKNQTDEIALQGIKFWSNVCEKELNLAAEAEEAQEQGTVPQYVSRHYSKGALPHILPILTQKLVKKDEDNEDEPAKAAAVCITLLAQCTQDAIVEQILPFITQHFGNDNWHYKEAAIMAFGSIVEGPSAQSLHQLVEQAIMPLIGTLNDAHAAVRDAAVWAIGRICDTCADVVTRPETLQSLIPALFTALHQEPRVAFNVCWAISNLAKAAYQVAAEQGTDENGEPATYILSSVFQQMVDELIKTTDRIDANTANLRIAGYEALMELIKNSPQDCYAVVQQTTLIVLMKLEQLLNIEHSLLSDSDKAQLRDLQSLLCATLQSVLHKMHREDVPAISDPIMAGLLQIMQRCVSGGVMEEGKESGGVMEDALVAVTELIIVMGVQFGKYMDQFKPFLLAGLVNYEDPQVCLAAIGVLSDLCRAFEGQIFPLMDEFMAHLLKILENTTVKCTVKPHALGCFGDIALALGSNFARYLNIAMDWLVNAASAAQISNPDDIDQIEYVELLREHCIASFTGIVNALRGQNELALLLPYVQDMVQPIDMVAQSGSLSSESLQASACGLIGDLVTSVGQPILPIVETEQILQMLQKCRRSKHNKAKTLAQWTTREISRVRRQQV